MTKIKINKRGSGLQILLELERPIMNKYSGKEKNNNFSQVVSVCAFFSNDPSLNSAWAYGF